jgi:hypothetical protein
MRNRGTLQSDELTEGNLLLTAGIFIKKMCIKMSAPGRGTEAVRLNPKSAIQNPKSEIPAIRNPQSKIRNPQSEIISSER